MNNSYFNCHRIIISILVCSFLLCQNIDAQVQVIQDNSVGVGTDTPHPSAKLEINSETQGFLMPRLTIAQRNAIALPSDGLEVYVTDNDDTIRGPWYYDAGLGEWIKLNLPTGGTDGQVLSIDADGNYVWVTIVDSDMELPPGGTNGQVLVTDGNGNYSWASIMDTDTNIYNSDGTLSSNRNVNMNGKVLNFDNGRIELSRGNNNVLIGDASGASISSGKENVALGGSVLNSTTVGARNVGVGHHVLLSNKNGNNNIGLGFESLNKNISGHQNVGIGFRCLNNNTTGTGNIAMGVNSSLNNQTGKHNLSIGHSALSANTSGSYNLALGFYALKDSPGSHNLGIGYYSMWAAKGGAYNIGLGTHSLAVNKSGVHNVALGSNALRRNTTGNYNFAGIVGSLSFNTTGGFNTAIGYLALEKNTTGGSNVGIGYNTLRNNTIGAHNVGIGPFAIIKNKTGNFNIGIGTYTLKSNEAGLYNVALGYRAGWSTTGSQNVFLGKEAGYFETGSNRLYIDNSSTANPLIYGEFDNNLLRVNGTLHATEHIQDSNGDLGTNGQLLGRDADGVVWQDAPASSSLPSGGADGQILATDGSGSYYWTDDENSTDTDWIETSNAVYNDTKEIGIGTANPIRELDVYGRMHLRYSPGNNGASHLVIGTGGSSLESSAHHNILIGGSDNGTNLTTGSDNTFIGYHVGDNTTTGNHNVMMGFITGEGNTTGTANIFLGTYSGNSNGTGDNNSYMGFQSGYSNVDGSDNTYLGSYSGASQTTGFDNTFIGRSAGSSLIDGSGNVFLGRYSGGGSTSVSNKLSIANGPGNELISGNFSTDEIDLKGDVDVTGDLHVTGTVTGAVKNFRIDHPLDPQNKDLVFASIEAPELLNTFRGNVTTDENGFATVDLPEYFAASNKDFSYYLTCVGVFAQAIVFEEIGNGGTNQFKIQTDIPNVKVSWQVLSARDDAYARANPLEVETTKFQKTKFDNGSAPAPAEKNSVIETKSECTNHQH